MSAQSASATTSKAKGKGKRKREDDSQDTNDEPKRPAKALAAASSTEKPIHPMFLGDRSVSSPAGQSFKWLPKIGNTCYHGVHLTPKCSTKVAAFDLDGTLIRPASGGRFYKDFSDWRWWGEADVVTKKLKALLEEGYAIVIISNQAIPGTMKDAKKRQAYEDKFLKKIPLIAAKIPSIPFRLLAATAKDQYRKPMVETWYALERVYRDEGVTIDLQSSYYVGDAAGRSGDHNISDRLYALNVGIAFHTPEEFFLGKAPKNFKMKGFHPSSIPEDPNITLYTPSDTPLIPPDPIHPEVVLFIGFPAVGKSSFYKTHFSPAGYVHVNQDTLKTKPACVKAVKEALKQGKSCVVDNTNRDIATRKEYVDLARDLKASIRAIHFDVPIALAWHINLYRTFAVSDDVRAKDGQRELVPYIGFTGFQNAFQKPTVGEGFSEVKTVKWKFEGTEDDRRRFNRYLDIF